MKGNVPEKTGGNGKNFGNLYLLLGEKRWMKQGAEWLDSTGLPRRRKSRFR